MSDQPKIVTEMKRFSLYISSILALVVLFCATANTFAKPPKKQTKPPVSKNVSAIQAATQRQKELNAAKEAQANPADTNAGTEQIGEFGSRTVVADITIKRMLGMMSDQQREEFIKAVMTVDPSTITELSTLPGNTPEEKRLYLVRFLQSQGIEVPGAPPLENAPANAPNGQAPAQPNGDNPLTPVGEGKPVVELISGGQEAENAPPLPLYQQTPFDEITLVERFDNTVLKVAPLPFRTVPADDDVIRKKPLNINLDSDPENKYTLIWNAIAKFRFFEEMIADKAMELSKDGKFEEAFVYIKFLMDEYPSSPQIQRSLEMLYFDEAKAFTREKKYDVALARLMEAFDLFPKSEVIEKPLSNIVNKLTEQYLEAGDYESGRIMLDNLLTRYPKNELGQQLRKKFVDMCQADSDEATQAWKDNNKAKAALAVERMKLVWPSLEDVNGGKEIVETVKNQYPAIRVGVTMPCSDCVGVGLNDWSSYRSRRLMYRLMTEFKGPGSEGGSYESPLGEVKIEDLGRRLVFKLNDNLRWASSAGGDTLCLSGADVASAALDMANSSSATYSPQWASLLKSVNVPSPKEATIQLNRPYVCPLALLQNPVLCYTSGCVGEDTDSGANGSYLPGVLPYQDKVGAKQKLYLFNERYFAGQPKQPRMITEVYYDKGQQALKDLEAGKIVALDRINPWDVPVAQENKNIQVHPYAMPLVHCIVPNRSKLLLSNRTYRRALVYALNREGILKHLIGGEERQGCRVVSGPFSPGVDVGDPLGYAYDANLAPRPYNPYLAFALTQAAMLQIDKAQKAQAEKDAKKKGTRDQGLGTRDQGLRTGEKEGTEEKSNNPQAPESNPQSPVPSPQSPESAKPPKKKDLFEQKFVLGYPPHETARIACQIIARQYKAIGIEIELYEFPVGEPVRMSDKIDLLYMELAMYEPIVDAPRILGSDGPSGKCSPHTAQALRELDGATDWTAIGRTMRRLHKLSYDDTAIIPLWQIRDYFAVNARLQGVVEAEDVNPVSLYERIEDWAVTDAPAPEAKK